MATFGDAEALAVAIGDGTALGTTVGITEAVGVPDGGARGVTVTVGDADTVVPTVGAALGKFGIVGVDAVPPLPPPQADNPNDAKASKQSIIFCTWANVMKGTPTHLNSSSFLNHPS